MAKAVAQNLQDSGWKISIILRTGSIRAKDATNLGFSVHQMENFHWSNLSTPLFFLFPDHEHKSFLEKYGGQLPKDTLLLYAHGFSHTAFDFAKKYPEFHHSLFALKAIAHEVRQNYLSQKLLMAAVDIPTVPPETVTEMAQWLDSMALACGISLPLIKSSFKEECLADLFTEQSILCYFIPYLSEKIFTVMQKKGISSEIAFVESFYEMKLIVDALMEVGPKKFFSLISPNALMGSEWARKFYQNEISLNKMNEHWKELTNTNLADEFTVQKYRSEKQHNEDYWKDNPLQLAFEKWKERK